VVPWAVCDGVAPLGVAPCTLILGNTTGADVFVGVEADPDSSAFFPAAIELRLVCLEVTRVAGGGLFNRGEAGHCGVVSPEAGPALFAPAREGSFDTASVTAPPVPAESCGTLLAESARCIAAAEGCDELDWLDRVLRPSLRMGDGFREVLGLEVEDCEEEVGSIEAECCLRNVGARVEDVELWRVALGLLRWTVAVEDADAEDISEPSDGGAGGRSAGGFACPSAVGRRSWVSVGMV
jgi:hypothetical protein